MQETNIFGLNVPDYKDSADGIVFSNLLRKMEELITKRVIYMNSLYEFIEETDEIRITLNYTDNPAKVMSSGQMFLFRCEGEINKTTKIRVGSLDFKDFTQKRNYANGEYIQVLYEEGIFKDVSQVRDISTGNGLKDVDLSSKDYTIELGTPSTINKSSTNIATGETHRHALNLTDYTFNAGQGLNGSGNIQDNVITFNLGTPSQISKLSTNSVGEDTHSHFLDLTQYVVNIGLGLDGEGNMQDGMNLRLGTPSTLDCSTVNASGKKTHTHKLERATNQDIVQALNETKVMTPKDVKTSIDTHSISVPLGGMIDWATPTPPTNFMFCDGTYISKTEYSELFSVLGTKFGESGNNFRLPPIMNTELFIRYGGTNVLGRVQDWATQKITGIGGGKDDQTALAGVSGAFYRAGSFGYDARSSLGGRGWKLGFDSSRVVKTCAETDETRPKNITLAKIIRVK